MGLALCAAAARAQTVVANVPTPGHDLRTESESLEAAGDLLGAAALQEAALEHAPGDVSLHWRLARNLVRHAERHPQLDSGDRNALYERARDLARAGRTLDPDCAECCLYEFAGTASLAKAHGLLRAAASVREAGKLLEQCLANPPHSRDASGSEEASLYFGASVFFRRMPDSDLIAWATGQHRDTARAVGLARRAVAIEGERVRYRLELSAALLCDGTRHKDAGELEEGRRWLEATATAGGADGERARELAGQEPKQACELSHDEPEAGR